MTTLCLVERDGDAVAAASAAALSFARSLAPADGEPVTAVLFGSEPVPADLGAAGVTSAYQVTAPGLTGYAPAAWASSLQQLAAARDASAVVAAATDRGAEVLAQLGALTGLPVAANCVSALAAGPGSWRLVRQRWAGSVLEDALLEAPLALLTVASDAVTTGSGITTGSMGAAVAGSAAEVTAFTPELSASDLLVQATESSAHDSGTSLASARVVVGGGRGVGGPEGFAALEELAALLGGVVGVSRVVTSAGWRPHRQQVGQTGTKIAPELYLACGISGAIQHMAGCQGARHIIVINTDASAPIMSRADYAVVGDLHEIIPELVAAIRAAG